MGLYLRALREQLQSTCCKEFEVKFNLYSGSFPFDVLIFPAWLTGCCIFGLTAFRAMPLSWVKTRATKPKKQSKGRAAKAKSKPAAKPKAARKSKAKRSAPPGEAEVPEAPKTMEPFDLEAFIQRAWQLGGYEPVGSPGLASLLLASGCTGSGSFAYVCKKMLRVAGGKVKGVEQYGADWSTASQLFLLRNHRSSGCLFQDCWGKDQDPNWGDPLNPKRSFWFYFVSRWFPKRSFWFHFVSKLFPKRSFCFCSRHTMHGPGRGNGWCSWPWEAGLLREALQHVRRSSFRRCLPMRVRLLLEFPSKPEEIQAGHRPSKAPCARCLLPGDPQTLAAAETEGQHFGEHHGAQACASCCTVGFVQGFQLWKGIWGCRQPSKVRTVSLSGGVAFLKPGCLVEAVIQNQPWTKSWQNCRRSMGPA